MAEVIRQGGWEHYDLFSLPDVAFGDANLIVERVSHASDVPTMRVRLQVGNVTNSIYLSDESMEELFLIWQMEKTKD